jgi:enterochelin esterase-like enzyme
MVSPLPVPPPSPFVSPRVARLAEQLVAGNHAAVGAFWDEVAEQGTPLVEALPGDARHLLVTFLWRATAPTSAVLLAGGPASHRALAAHALGALPGSDVWYRTYWMRNDARFGYLLAPDGIAVPQSFAAIPARMAAFRLDSLNQHPFLSATPVVSTVELPDAPPQPWLAARDDVPRGTVQEQMFRSTVLGNDRHLWVYTPPGYTGDGAPYGLLLLFDGESYTTTIPTPTILDNLIADAIIPPLVAVMVANPDPQARMRELSCHPPLVACFAQELVPWLRAHYHLTTDPTRAIIGGSSLGGLAAADVAVCRPDLFANVLSQSGCAWWNAGWTEAVAVGDEPERFWLVRELVRRERLPLRFQLSAGLMEQGGVGHMQLPVNELASTRHMRDVLEAKGYTVHYQEFNGGHDALGWRSVLPDALRVLTQAASGA